MKEEKDINVIEKVTEEVDKSINRIMQQGVQTNNVDFLYKMIDIKKDIAEIEKEEEEMMYRGRNSYNDGHIMNYGNYDNRSYGRRRRDSRGRFMEGTRNGRSGNYRGHEVMDEMYDYYGNYMEGKEQYNEGNYGAKGDTMKSLEYMLESVVEFMEMLKQDATSQEEVELIKHYSKKISQM